MSDSKRPCGLYRTTVDRDGLEAPLLVYFHNHSEKGPPIILLPAENRHNKWSFRSEGILIDDDYAGSLESLPREGLYTLSGHFHPNDREIVAKGALVQLGYNRAGESILFFPRPLEGENGLFFPSKGMKIPDRIVKMLVPADLRGPHRPRQLH